MPPQTETNPELPSESDFPYQGSNRIIYNGKEYINLGGGRITEVRAGESTEQEIVRRYEREKKGIYDPNNTKTSFLIKSKPARDQNAANVLASKLEKGEPVSDALLKAAGDKGQQVIESQRQRELKQQAYNQAAANLAGKLERGELVAKDQQGNSLSNVQITPSSASSPSSLSLDKPFTSRSEFAESLFASQGKSVKSRDGVTTIEDGERKVILTPTSDAIVPSSANVNVQELNRFESGKIIKAKINSKKNKENGSNNFSGNSGSDIRLSDSGLSSVEDYKGSIQEAQVKVPLATKLSDYSVKNQGTFTGIIAGSAAAGTAYAVGTVKGFVSFFNPQTYVNLAKSVYSLKDSEGRSSMRSSFYEMGGKLYASPEQGFGVAGEFYGFGKGLPIAKKGFQTVQKLRPGYVSTKDLKLNIVEGVTIEKPLKELYTFEKKTVPTIHATYSTELKPGVAIELAPTESLSGWRKAIGQRNFYTSAPSNAKITKIVNGVEVPTSFEGTPIVPRYNPNLYGGYIGIGKGYSGSIVEESFLPKPGRAFIFRDTQITPTPKSVAAKDIRTVVKYQTENPGTYVSAENIKGLSVEGQFTTSAGSQGNPLFRIRESPGELSGKFTYYNVKKPTPPYLGGEKTPKPIRPIVKGAYDFLTSENQKIKFFEARLEPIAENIAKGVGDTEKVIKYASESKLSRSVLPEYSRTSIPKTQNPTINSKGISFDSRVDSIPSTIFTKSNTFQSRKIPSSPSTSVNISSLPLISSLRKSPSQSTASSLSRSKSSSISSSSISSSSTISSSSSQSSSSSNLKSTSSSISSPSSSRSSSNARSSSSRFSYESSFSYGSSSSYSYYYTPPYTPPPTPFPFESKNRFYQTSRKAFDVQIKRFGKYQTIAQGLPKGLATKSLVKSLKSSLGASGRLVSKGETRLKDIAFNVDENEFRSYRIKQGKKVPLENFGLIQKKGFRLSSASETSEIKRFRKGAKAKL